MARVARAQAYPMRPVRIIVGFGADGTADIVARMMGGDVTVRSEPGKGSVFTVRLPGGMNT